MNIFELVKEYTMFADVAREHRIEFKNGKALCPFHKEKTPSFHNYGEHGYCFGCRKRADVIDLESQFTGLSPCDAALSLAKRYKIPLPEFSLQDRQKAEKQLIAYELLARLAIYANKEIKKHPKVLKHLKSKGLDQKDIDLYLIGYVDGTNPVTNKVLINEKERELAREIGLINQKGDYFRNRIIYPLWNYGKIIYITGRAFPSGEPKFLHLPHSELLHKPIAFKENLKKDVCVITEGITDALAFIKAGIPACALVGTEPGAQGRAALLKAKGKLYFCFDNDKTGEDASYKLAREFKGYLINLEQDKDADEILGDIGVDRFRKLTEETINKSPYYLDVVIEKENVKESLYEIAKLEFASDREKYLRKLKDKTGFTLEALKEDLERVKKIREDEELKKASREAEMSSQTKNPLSVYTPEEIEKAEGILKSPDVLEKVVKITERAGYVGEERNKKLTYLACMSRKLPGKGKAISLITKGESGSGKSKLVRHILKLMPPRDYKEFTFITEKSLLYKNESLSNKILCVFEREGGKTADYTLRTAISEEELSISTTEKDPNTGEFKSVEKRIPAEGLVFIETTIEEHIEPQNENRTFDFFTDNSPEVTRDVLRAQARKHIQDEKELEGDYRVWQCLQDLLQPLPVYIPFAKEVAEQFPADKVRARRDFPRLLALIEASALLHQKNRERVKSKNGQIFIKASEQDFNIAYDIIEPILSQIYKELSPKEEALIRIVKDEFGIGCFADSNKSKSNDVGAFSPKELWDKIKARFKQNQDKTARDFVKYSTLRKYIKQLVDKGIVDWNGEKGAKSKYILITGIPKTSLSISLSTVANPQKIQSSLGKTSATQGHSSCIANGLASEGLAMDAPISSILATDERSSSSAYKSLDNSDISSLATQVLYILYREKTKSFIKAEIIRKMNNPRINPVKLNAALKRLRRENLITSEEENLGAEDYIRYKITERGRNMFATFLNTQNSAINTRE